MRWLTDARALAAVGALFAGSGVATGAFGAHALESRLDAELLAIWETAASYHLLHGVAVVAVATWLRGRSGGIGWVGGWMLVAGTVVFAGSLYLLAGSGVRGWGAVTPVGGLLLLGGWGALAVALARSPSSQE